MSIVTGSANAALRGPFTQRYARRRQLGSPAPPSARSPSFRADRYAPLGQLGVLQQRPRKLPRFCRSSAWQGPARPRQPYVVAVYSVRLNETASAGSAAGAGVLRPLRRRGSSPAQGSKRRGGGWPTKRRRLALGQPHRADNHSEPTAAPRGAGLRRRMERFTNRTSGGVARCWCWLPAEQGTSAHTRWRRCDDSKTRDELRLQPRPLAETFADTVHWLAEAGHLTPREAGRLA